MKTTVQRTIGFLGAALMATQLVGATRMETVPSRSSSGLCEQAMPVNSAQIEVGRLLKQISANAAIASKYADRLEAFTRIGSRLAHETHASELMGAKEAIHAMGTDLRQLQKLYPSALLWQQLVIDRIEPVLIGLASHTTDATKRLNAERGKLSTTEYRDAVLNLGSYARAARSMIAVNMDYAVPRQPLTRPAWNPPPGIGRQP